MYRVITDPAALEQIVALPYEALTGYSEALGAVELAPWNGPPHHAANPEVRRWVFGPGGAGQVVYLVLDPRREVHVLLVQWLG